TGQALPLRSPVPQASPFSFSIPSPFCPIGPDKHSSVWCRLRALSHTKRLAGLLREKSRAYGDSFGASGEFLRILWPDGIPPESYPDVLAIVRIFDKLKRAAAGHRGAFGEDPFDDIAGYALLQAEAHGSGESS
ncbi:MAG: hypothetical protein V3T83_02995, partial [Acidobacteriota bacterium]